MKIGSIELDLVAVRELEHYADNTASLKEQKYSIELNLARKVAKGTYDRNKAPKLWGYWVESAAKSYIKEFGGSMRDMFPPLVRRSVAEGFAFIFDGDIADELYGDFREDAAKILRDRVV